MMEYADFYDIAVYGNENWNKGNFTPKEIACNAEIYYADFQWSKENDTISESIKSLCKNLAEDAMEYKKIAHHKDNRTCPEIYKKMMQPSIWLYQIASELGLIDMDCQDYLDTDEWLAEFM